MRHQVSSQSASAEHQCTRKTKLYWCSGGWCSGAHSWFGVLLLGFIVCVKPAYANDECQICHQVETDTFIKTEHARDIKSCSICHGNTDEHSKSENKKDNIINPAHFNTQKANAVCVDCHYDKDKDIDVKFKAMASLHDRLRCYECHLVHFNKTQENDLDSFSAGLSVDCALCHKEKAEDLADSLHGAANMECLDCHKLHTAKTISEDIEEQLDTCLSCHPAQELEFKNAYPHPLRERQVKCSDCHNPHSGNFAAMLKKDEDDTCGACHVNIVIEGGKHPVSKNTNHPFRTLKCMDCHRPHGSNFDKVLKYNIDNICKTCHN